MKELERRIITQNNYMQHIFTVSACSFWKSEPNYIKSIPSHAQFAKSLTPFTWFKLVGQSVM